MYNTDARLLSMTSVIEVTFLWGNYHIPYIYLPTGWIWALSIFRSTITLLPAYLLTLLSWSIHKLQCKLHSCFSNWPQVTGSLENVTHEGQSRHKSKCQKLEECIIYNIHFVKLCLKWFKSRCQSKCFRRKFQESSQESWKMWLKFTCDLKTKWPLRSLIAACPYVTHSMSVFDQSLGSGI